MFVYVIVCDESMKLYIGQHQGLDLPRYLQQKWSDAHGRRQGGRSRLYAAMRKYPRESWSIHPLVSGIQTKAELDEMEQLLIYALKAQHPDVGYNICDGGEGRTGPQSPLTRALISASLREQHKNGDRMSLAGRAAVGAKNRIHMTGTRQSEETRVKHREATKRLVAAGIIPKGRVPGFHVSSETREKMRASAKGRDMSKAVAASVAVRKGKTHPNRTTAAGIEKSKLVKFLKTVAWG